MDMLAYTTLTAEALKKNDVVHLLVFGELRACRILSVDNSAYGITRIEYERLFKPDLSGAKSPPKCATVEVYNA